VVSRVVESTSSTFARALLRQRTVSDPSCVGHRSARARSNMEVGRSSTGALRRACTWKWKQSGLRHKWKLEPTGKETVRGKAKVTVASDVLDEPEQENGMGEDNDGSERTLDAVGGERYRVKAAEFVKSSVKLEQCPPPTLPEFAVVGRSNVGKSSLINAITNRKNLALVSKTPGKTVCINHFIINKEWYLVDLPGYGYAKRSKTARFEWLDFTKDYFLNRETLANVLLLVDCSIPPQQIDVDCADWLGEKQVPLSIVFTKSDKRKKKAPPHTENIAKFREMLNDSWEDLPPMLVTSSIKGTGKRELLAHIGRVRSYWKSADEEPPVSSP